MFEDQPIITINKDELLAKVDAAIADGYRFVQMSCTKSDQTYIIDYTFDKEYKFHDLRLELPLADAELPSISAISPPAFLYENELHDLFGIKVTDISIDFKGKFYRLETEAPFSKEKD